MENKSITKKTIGIKGILIAFGLGVAGIFLWRLLKNHTQQANLASSNIDDLSTAQAAKFFGLFGVYREGGFVTATWIVKDTTQAAVMLLTQNIADWVKVQTAFTEMCSGNYTVLQAAKTALSAAAYSKFVDYISQALKQKMMFANNYPNIKAYLNNVSTNAYSIEIDPNTYIGRCQGEIGNYYKFISQDDGGTYYVEKKYCILK